MSEQMKAEMKAAYEAGMHLTNTHADKEQRGAFATLDNGQPNPSDRSDAWGGITA